MGIKDLYKCLRSITVDIHVSDLCGGEGDDCVEEEGDSERDSDNRNENEGKATIGSRKRKRSEDNAMPRAGIDASGWLYKIARGSGIVDKESIIKYCEKLSRLFTTNGIEPILVFDGESLGIKANGPAARRNKEQVQQRIERAARLALQGKHAEAALWKGRANHVSRETQRDVLQEMQRRGYRCVRAPYEADSQLAWMSLQGLVDVVVSEDSDMLAYGVSHLIVKLNVADGSAKLIQLRDLPGVTWADFTGWNQHMFLTFCILLGCDYIDRLRLTGPKRAHALVSAASIAHPQMFTESRWYEIPTRLELGLDPKSGSDKELSTSSVEGYASAFRSAYMIFRHGYAIDSKRQLVHVRDPSEEVKGMREFSALRSRPS